MPVDAHGIVCAARRVSSTSAFCLRPRRLHYSPLTRRTIIPYEPCASLHIRNTGKTNNVVVVPIT